MAVSLSDGISLDGFCFLEVLLEMLFAFWGGEEDGRLVSGRVGVEEEFELIIGTVSELFDVDVDEDTAEEVDNMCVDTWESGSEVLGTKVMLLLGRGSVWRCGGDCLGGLWEELDEEDTTAVVDVSVEPVWMLVETEMEEQEDWRVMVHRFERSLKHFLWKTFPHLSQRLGAALYLNMELQAWQALVVLGVIFEEEEEDCFAIWWIASLVFLTANCLTLARSLNLMRTTFVWNQIAALEESGIFRLPWIWIVLVEWWRCTATLHSKSLAEVIEKLRRWLFSTPLWSLVFVLLERLMEILTKKYCLEEQED